MLTAEQSQEADQAALGVHASDDFNWREWHLQKAEGFTLAAKSWRSIAHTAQLDGDDDVVRLAHGNALQNENWAKDSERKAAEI